MSKLQRIDILSEVNSIGIEYNDEIPSEDGKYYIADDADMAMKEMLYRLWSVMNNDSRIRKEVFASAVSEYFPEIGKKFAEEIIAETKLRAGEKDFLFGDRYSGKNVAFQSLGSFIEVRAKVNLQHEWDDQPVFEMQVPMIQLFSTLQRMADLSFSMGKPVLQFRWNHKGNSEVHYWVPSLPAVNGSQPG